MRISVCFKNQESLLSLSPKYTNTEEFTFENNTEIKSKKTLPYKYLKQLCKVEHHVDNEGMTPLH